MSNRRELISGFLAALVCVVIIGGSIITSMMERQLAASKLPEVINSSPAPSVVIATPRPGEPTPSSLATLQSTESGFPSDQTTTCSLQPGWEKIEIKPGDSLESLAEVYSSSEDALFNANCLFTEDLTPGTTLYVPIRPPSPTTTLTNTTIPCKPPWDWVPYIIQSGDTLYSLSRSYRITVTKLKAGNCITSDKIFGGDIIYVPSVSTSTPKPSYTPTITPSFTLTLTKDPPTATDTVLPTLTFTPTQTPSGLPPTDTPTVTFTPTNTITSTPTPSLTPSITPPPTDTITP